ncbi:MAG: hypothetical protein S4CHLAM7_03490 [Chlamydiae bacterium]|nr:hypothetical protein [Chlamydiota bacterium]
MTYKHREQAINRIHFSFKVCPVVALLGPRQCGKTNLARVFSQSYKDVNQKVHYFDLEDPEDYALFENPKLLLASLEGLIIIDEIQKVPEIFQLIRVLVDDPQSKKEFLILGSASRDLIRQRSESLAGRIIHIELTPFSYGEVHELNQLWIRGGFPKSYLALDKKMSGLWRKEYISTFLERDIPSLGFDIPAQSLRRFWMMLTAYHGNIFNASEMGRSLGISGPTIRRYIDLLSGTFMIRQLQPWFENISKRQVKSPKIYFRDSGIFHSLLGIYKEEEIRRHPKLGASWEGFAMEAIIRSHQANPEECFFWAVHEQAEIDLLLFVDGKRFGFEFKWADSPRLTKSLKIAHESLNLDKSTIIYPGKKSYPLQEDILVIGLEAYLKEKNAEST